MKVYEGPGMIADKAGAMILPVGLEGPQYSRLSYLKGQVRQRWLPRVRITILPPRRLDLPDEVRGSERRAAGAEALARIMREVSFENAFVRETLFDALIRSSRIHGPRRVAVEDITGTRLDLDRIVESSLRCQKIVFNLLSFARKHPPEKKLQNLNRCVEKVLDLHATGLQAKRPPELGFSLIVAAQNGEDGANVGQKLDVLRIELCRAPVLLEHQLGLTEPVVDEAEVVARLEVTRVDGEELGVRACGISELALLGEIPRLPVQLLLLLPPRNRLGLVAVGSGRAIRGRGGIGSGRSIRGLVLVRACLGPALAGDGCGVLVRCLGRGCLASTRVHDRRLSLLLLSQAQSSGLSATLRATHSM